MNWLARANTEAARRNLQHIPLYGRWDDLYIFVGTPLENDALQIMKDQLELDVQCKTPSLLAKWLKSENTSSSESRKLGKITRKYFGLTSKQYRKTLSILRERINVLERLMSNGEWDKIEFDKIPSKAGMKYKNAFARHDVERAKAGARTYENFAKDTTTKVNAKTLYPYECVAEARKYYSSSMENTNRLMTNKYWENLADYFQGASFNGMAIVDTSGSMCGYSADAPINVAISLGLYCAEKAQGPFHNHFMTFSNEPTFVEVQGADFCHKVQNVLHANWGMNTNIEAAFDLMLNVARANHCSQEEIPQNLIVISDMEFDACTTCGKPSTDSWGWGWNSHNRITNKETLFESMKRKWASYGYQMPKLTFWNVNARNNNIPMKDDGNVRYVSGMSPVIYQQIMKDLTAYDLMMDKIDSERYACIK